MQEVKDLSHEAYDHLMERDPNTWSRAFFKTDTSCDAVENGVSECFNSLIVSTRRKPIITMLEEIRLTIMERFEKMAKKVEKWNGDICPTIKKKVEINKDQMRYVFVSICFINAINYISNMFITLLLFVVDFGMLSRMAGLYLKQKRGLMDTWSTRIKWHALVGFGKSLEFHVLTQLRLSISLIGTQISMYLTFFQNHVS